MSNVVVQFDEPIKLGSGNISVSFGGQTVQIGADSSSVSVLGNSLIVNPDGDLPASTTFTVSMPAGFVTDLSQNQAAALNNYSFTTGVAEIEQPTDVMVDLRNLKLQNNVAANTARHAAAQSSDKVRSRGPSGAGGKNRPQRPLVAKTIRIRPARSARGAPLLDGKAPENPPYQCSTAESLHRASHPK